MNAPSTLCHVLVPGGRGGGGEGKSNVPRNLLKIFWFCEMFWIANNDCDTVNYEIRVHLSYCFIEVRKLW